MGCELTELLGNSQIFALAEICRASLVTKEKENESRMQFVVYLLDRAD